MVEPPDVGAASREPLCLILQRRLQRLRRRVPLGLVVDLHLVAVARAERVGQPESHEAAHAKALGEVTERRRQGDCRAFSPLREQRFARKAAKEIAGRHRAKALADELIILVEDAEAEADRLAAKIWLGERERGDLLIVAARYGDGQRLAIAEQVVG